MRSFCGGMARSYFKKKKIGAGEGVLCRRSGFVRLECSGFARGFIDWL